MIRIVIGAIISLLILYSILITKKTEYENKETLKIKNLIENKFSNKKKMLTTFLSSDQLIKNQSPKDYKKAYNYYSLNRREIQEILINEINNINQNINKNELIPIIKKNSIFILPMLYIKSVDLSDFIQEFNKKKLKYNDIFATDYDKNKDLVKENIFIGYSFFEIGKNKIIVVFSAPKDPDPLFTKNSRIVDIISFLKIAKNSQEYQIETDFLVLNGGSNND